MTSSPTRRSTAEVAAVHRIGDSAPHSAFTDLVRYAGNWFCAFREARTHLSDDGVIRVLTSVDGRSWTSAAVLRQAGVDLRDPRFVTRPDGRLQLLAAAATGETTKTFQTVTWHSGDGRAWGDPVPVGEPGVWVWRAAWHDGAMYGVGYATREPRFARLYRSTDGVDLQPWVPVLYEGGYPNESGLVFTPDGSAFCLLRRDGPEATAQLGRALPPYRDWSWTDLDVQVGGPALLRLPDGRLLAGVRLHDGEVRTAICSVDPDRGELTELVALPSGGDTSYPGLVWHDDLLWVSYYSSHEERTSVYLAEVRLTD
ncbi:sialidase family protein [Micromonospora sp. WMMD961]|uniref:sialidase family protein n=1 Tax=Micromonospora sp. WMMD961 TaxID=3016100 RepID=UPI0024179DDB|nr:sialidase family protein [Micromonospora sp. WMMD961]MDG4781585.1 sialidase family protein [Micromonospora sp. WMMD961]